MPLIAILGYYSAGHCPGNPTDFQMKKLLIIITCFASLLLSACSSWHLVHKIDVQQGNVITQDEINQLEPGMSRRQVQFIMGSPMVADVFHQDRWDYIYRLQPGYGEPSEEHVTLFFDDDSLERITGSLHPEAAGAGAPARPRQVTLEVPPEERIPPGILSRFWHWLTFRKAMDEEIIASDK
jgi:outer membrane protein assembly factor BamE